MDPDKDEMHIHALAMNGRAPTLIWLMKIMSKKRVKNFSESEAD